MRRDKSEKESTPLDGLPVRVPGVLDEIQSVLYQQAEQRQRERTVDVTSVDDAIEAARTGFARLPWKAGDDDAEDRLNKEGVTVRCLQRSDGAVPSSGS